jgi:hypothetical protein
MIVLLKYKRHNIQFSQLIRLNRFLFLFLMILDFVTQRKNVNKFL